jgi:beta-glucosidase
LPAGMAISWQGDFTTQYAGTYWLDMQTLGAATNLTVDGKSKVTTAGGSQRKVRYGSVHPSDGNGPLPTTDGLANGRVAVSLSKGKHRLSVSAVPDASGRPVEVRLNWTTPAERVNNTDLAVAAAKKAKTAIVFAWADGNGDLSKPLPDGQDALIQAVAAANPNTIVVLNTAQPVAMPWLHSVRSVLEMWYPGDRGGQATVNVLLGITNPDGRLPFTWPAAVGQELAHQGTHPERNSYGLNPTSGAPCAAPAGNDPTCVTTYSEGVDVGYRYYAADQETPLYPFGYGLSYGAYAYSGITTSHTDDGGLDASFQVTNTGKLAGNVTPQVYLGAPDDPPAGAQFAPIALAGFARVHLAAGQTSTVTIPVAHRALQYWSTADSAWTDATGTRTLTIAANSATPELQTQITVS